MTDIDWRVLKANADAERAQLNRILADIRDTINTSAESTLLQANATSTLTTEQGLSGMATAWRDTNARVTRNGNNITALAEDITFLSARVDDLDEDMYGEAGALQLLSARVDSNEDGITANANSLLKLGALTPDGSAFLLDSGTVLVTPSQSLAQWRTELNTSLDDKASSSTVTELSNTVSEQGGLITAQGQQLSGLSASVGDNEASINELREVAVSAVSGNAVINPSFETDGGWNFTGPNVYITTNANAPTGARVLRFDSGSGHAISLSSVPVRTGQRVRLGGIMRPMGSIPNSGARLRLIARCYDADGAYLFYATVEYFDRPGSYVNTPVEGVYTVPAGVGRVAFQLTTDGHTSGAFAIDDVYLEPVSESLADVLARYSLAVTAGGDVAGMELLAGGGISAIRFLADSFSVVNPGGTNGWEFNGASGHQITRGGSYMKVEGAPFGVGNGFLFWMGPNLSNISQCSTANAMFALMTNGNMFLNGAIINGMIEKTTSTSQLGPVPTLGNDIFVDASLRGSNMVTSNVQQQGALQVRGSTSFPVTLQRRIGSGSWQTVATTTGSSSWSEITHVDGVDQATAQGGITPFEYVDTDPSLSDRYYRLVRGTVTGAVEYRRGLSGSWINAGVPSNYRIKSSEVAG